MPFDLAILDEAIARIKRVTPSPPGSVKQDGIVMHEILGGETDRPKLFRKGYFLLWARGLSNVIPAIVPQEAAPNTPVPNPPSVSVRDAAGQPIAGFPLRFTVTAGGGFLDSNQTVVDAETDAAGNAAVKSWTLGPAEGANEFVAEGFGVSRIFPANAVTIRRRS